MLMSQIHSFDFFFCYSARVLSSLALSCSFRHIHKPASVDAPLATRSLSTSFSAIACEEELIAFIAHDDPGLLAEPLTVLPCASVVFVLPVLVPSRKVPASPALKIIAAREPPAVGSGAISAAGEDDL